jgi:predicted GIY-YIG superfamily endonuclease
MSKKSRQPTSRLIVDGWIVYIVQCADGSLYTGITKDVKRRCQQHNAGTASRYTRSRGPVKLVYREDQPDQSSALKREAAIKAMTRPGKLAMIQSKRKPAQGKREVSRLEDIPNVGPATAADLRRMGVTTPAELPGRDPFAL